MLRALQVLCVLAAALLVVAPLGNALNGNTGPADCNTQPGNAADVDNSGFATRNGKLKLSGVQLVNEAGQPVQLRGLSTHGLHFLPDCYRTLGTASLPLYVRKFGINVIRAAMYIDEGGFASSPGKAAELRAKIDEMVQVSEQLGIYFIIDWHIVRRASRARPRSAASR
jgi:endoglucanase